MSDQLKPVTHLSVDYFAAVGGIIGGRGPLARHTELIPAINIVIKTKRITFFRILFSFRVGSRPARNDRKFYFRASTTKSICNLLAAGGERVRESCRVNLHCLPVTNKTIACNLRITLFCKCSFLQGRQLSSATTAILFLGPWKPAQGKKGSKRPGEGIQVLRGILSLTQGFRAVLAREFNKIESQTL
jgi:hypothetical protein